MGKFRIEEVNLYGSVDDDVKEVIWIYESCYSYYNIFNYLYICEKIYLKIKEMIKFRM